MKRRLFLKQASLAGAGVQLLPAYLQNSLRKEKTNKLQEWKGFNLLDFFSPDPARNQQVSTNEHFSWMRDWGFDFVRIPVAYPWYLNIDRTRDINADETYKIDEQQIEKIEKTVHAAIGKNLHVSLNLHRGPGYCVNAGFHEPFNLWRDEEAQKAFVYHWSFWAKRFNSISSEKLSFDLLNEPSDRADMNDQHAKAGPVPGAVYRKVAGAAADAIRKENNTRIIIADGNNMGNLVIPELTDLPIAQSCRGYFPGGISHFKAPWANKDPEHMPTPSWPLKQGEKTINKESLLAYYQPWIDLVQNGTGVHCGECGCWKKTPHDVFLAWFGDVLDILSANKIGFATWNFIGDFGILDSGREDVAYTDWYGHKLDKKMLDLMRKK